VNDLTDPVPTGTILFLDERQDCYGANYWLDMQGYPNSPNAYQFYGDMPALYHNGASSLSFADGHVEPKRWRDPRTLSPGRTIPRPRQTTPTLAGSRSMGQGCGNSSVQTEISNPSGFTSIRLIVSTREMDSGDKLLA
jgi:prepilin-type processing-associated H-X9-DG protein